MSHLIKNGTSLLRQGNNIFGVKDHFTTIITPIATYNSYGIDLDIANNKYYITNYTGGSIQIYNYTTNALISTISGFVRPFVIKIAATNNVYYVTQNTNPATIRIMRYSDNTQLALVTLTGYTNAYGIELDSANDKFYVACYDGVNSFLLIYRASTNNMLEQISIPSCYSITLDIPNNRYYCCIYDSSIQIYNYTTNALISTISGVVYPTSLSLDIANNKYYITNYTGGSIQIYNYTTNALISTISGVVYPYSVVANSVNNEIFFTCIGQNINRASFTVN